MHIAIVDDNLVEAARLQELLETQLSAETVFSVFIGGEAFLKQWQPHKYELIILDIFMDDLSGIETARRIRLLDEDVCLIFCSNSNEFASESYDVKAQYYLLKPVTEKSLQQMLNRLELESLEKLKSVTLPNGTRILLQHILYAESAGHNITIYLKKKHTVTVRMTLKNLEELLCANTGFILCSKGVIVNLGNVIGLNEAGFLLDDKRIVPVSRRRMKEVKELYADFLFQQLRRRG